MAEVLARRCEDSPQTRMTTTDTITSTTAKSTQPKSTSSLTTNVPGKTRIPTSTSMVTNGTRNLRSPRCEAFLMTGDKMLILNPKISPYYAKMKQEQFLPSVQLYDGESATKKTSVFEFPADHVVYSRRRSSDIVQSPVSQSDQCISEFNKSNVGPEVPDNDSANADCGNSQNAFEKKYSVNTLPDIPAAPYDVEEREEKTTNQDLSTSKPPADCDTRPVDSTLAKRLIGSSQSATSSPLKRQSGSTIAADDCNSLALSANYSGGVAVPSSAATSQYGSMLGNGEGGAGAMGSAKRRMRRDESSLSDVTTTLSMSMPRAETITRVATQLFTLQAGYTLADVTTFLTRRDCELSQKVAAEFMSFFNFSGKRLDVALREFLNHVSLIGETSERTHILTHFSARYFSCNPTLFHGVDEIHALVCALILLNTDLHGANVTKKMTIREFVDNLLHTQYDYDRNMLKTLYNAIKETPFVRVTGAEAASPTTTLHRPSVDNGIISSISEKTPTLPPDDLMLSRHRRGTSITTSTSIASPITTMTNASEMHSRRGTTDRSKKRRRNTISSREHQDLNMFVNPREQVDYKRGWLLKKSVYDADGRRTPFGRRKWQMFYATLRGMALYLHRNEKVFECSRHETFSNCIRLHHSIAEVARDYKKRQHVFRLRTASFGEILFETSESAEVQRWIDAINYVSAAFSTPPLPVAISSTETATGAPPAAFFRFPPALPVAPTTLSMTEQLRAHCERLDEITEALAKLRAMAPSIKAKGRTVYEYFYRERYLDKERERYSIYVSILGDKLKAASQVDVSSVASSCAAKKNSLNVTSKLNCLPSTEGNNVN